MDFVTVFLRGMTLLPGVIQGTEGLFGAKTGEQKKTAALEIVGAAINIADAVSTRADCGCGEVYGGIGPDRRWRGGLSECESLGETLVGWETARAWAAFRNSPLKSYNRGHGRRAAGWSCDGKPQ